MNNEWLLYTVWCHVKSCSVLYIIVCDRANITTVTLCYCPLLTIVYMYSLIISHSVCNWIEINLHLCVCFCQGFPLTVCPDAMLEIGKHSADNGKTFAMNLSAPFLCSVFKKPMLDLIPYVDILFGNESVSWWVMIIH